MSVEFDQAFENYIVAYDKLQFSENIFNVPLVKY